MLLVKQLREHARFPEGTMVMVPMRFENETVCVHRPATAPDEVLFAVPDPGAGEWPVLRMKLDEYLRISKAHGCSCLTGLLK